MGDCNVERAAGRVWRVIVARNGAGGYVARAVREGWAPCSPESGPGRVMLASSPLALAFADWLARRMGAEMPGAGQAAPASRTLRARLGGWIRGRHAGSAILPPGLLTVALRATSEVQSLGAGRVTLRLVADGYSGAGPRPNYRWSDAEQAEWALRSEGDLGREIEALLEGRLLTAYEIHRLLSRYLARPLPPDSVAAALQALQARGACVVRPGVALDGVGVFHCTRCGSTQAVAPIECPACLSTGWTGQADNSGRRGWACWPTRQPPPRYVCVACRECSALGVLTSCTPVYLLSGRQRGQEASRLPKPFDSVGLPPPAERRRVAFRLEFELTAAQREASARLVEFIRDARPGRRECLVLAACGAGKTEACYAAVQHVVSEGGRVLVAVPRRDAALQIASRLAGAFDGSRVTCLVGGAGEDGLDEERAQARPAPARYGPLGDITVATTHQCLRLCDGFDLVVLDEVDAFPYSGSRMLYHAVVQAARAEAPVVYMTATPEPWLLDAVRSGRLGLVTIPARHHGWPLPVPRVERCPDEPGAVVQAVAGLARRSLAAGARVLVFGPTISFVELLGSALARRWAEQASLDRPLAERASPEGQASAALPTYVHSRDAQRTRKVAAFCAGRLPLLVSTTLLERSLTVDGVHVIVAMADYERVFCERTLVQIAGRVGRTSSHPTGDVWFVASRISAAMRRALDLINGLNRAAREGGYLRADDDDDDT